MHSHGGQLDDYNSRFVVYQVTLAVQFLHENDIAHRDIKPENVLVSHGHLGGRIVLTDFGFAIHTNTLNVNLGNGTGTRRMYSTIGTDGFAAPCVVLSPLVLHVADCHSEITRDASSGYSVGSDLWSLGVLTACILTGDSVIPRQQLCHLNKTGLETLCSNIRDDVYVNDEWMRLPTRALKFIQRLLVINPGERMTADQAISHSWFTKPRGEAAALRDGLDRLNQFWMKRDTEAEVLESVRGAVIRKRNFPFTYVFPVKLALKTCSRRMF